MIFSILPFVITNFLIPDPQIWFCIPAFTADAVSINLNSYKMLLSNGLSKFFIKGKLVLNYDSTTLPRIPPNCIILNI